MDQRAWGSECETCVCHRSVWKVKQVCRETTHTRTHTYTCTCIHTYKYTHLCICVVNENIHTHIHTHTFKCSPLCLNDVVQNTPILRRVFGLLVHDYGRLSNVASSEGCRMVDECAARAGHRSQVVHCDVCVCVFHNPKISK